MSGESGQSLRFDLTDLYMTAPAFSRAGGAIADAVSQVQSQLLGMGAFWGNDAPGQKFASFYAGDQDQLLQLLAVVAGEVQGISDGINKMASNYGITENANVNKMRALEQEMQ
jgi:hypothetical protein